MGVVLFLWHPVWHTQPLYLFNGPYYRTAAVFHQAACLLTLGKLYTLAVKLVFKLLPVYKPPLKVE